MLELLQASSVPMSLSRISEEAATDASTVHRLLKSLTRLGYVLRDPYSKLYLPSPKALLPLSLYHPLNEFRGDAHDCLRRVREETGLTVAIALFIRWERLVVELVAGRERMSPLYETYLKRPIHSSATGKVLLQTVPEESWASLLGAEPYAAFTENTITTSDKLRAEVEEAKQRGFSSTRDESLVGLSAVAAPLRSGTGQIVGCLVGFGASQGMLAEERRDELARNIVREANLLFVTGNSLKELVPLLISRASLVK
jgi:DNA-binding IclR family transcriptional regulator